jgi:peptidyl-tRNA hydrolase, PTH1 family
MHLVFGLGNPDPQYQSTRHNVGQWLLSTLAKKLSAPNFANQKKLACQTTKKDDLVLAFSTLYMNQSGQSVQKISSFFKIPPQNIFIIHDDLDLPVGNYKIQFDRGSAGHHGLESIIKQLKTQAFWRVRLGIGRSGHISRENYVLQKPNIFDKIKLQKTIQSAVNDLLENHLGPVA